MNDIMRHKADKIIFGRGLTCEEANSAFSRLYGGLRPGVTEEDLDYAFYDALENGDGTVNDAVEEAREFWKGSRYMVGLPERPDASEIMAAAVVLAAAPDAAVSFGPEKGVEPSVTFGVGGPKEADGAGKGASTAAWRLAFDLAADLHAIPRLFLDEFREGMEIGLFSPLDKGEERMAGLRAFLEGTLPDLAIEVAKDYVDAEMSRKARWCVEEEFLLTEMSRQSGREVLLLDDPSTDWREHLPTAGDGFSAVAWNSGGGVWKAASAGDRAALRLRGTVGRGPWTVVSLDGRSGEFKAGNIEEAARAMAEWRDEKDEIG